MDTEPSNPLPPADRSKKIVIVGAGLSGLVTAKTLLEDGFTNIQIIESHHHIAGVWAHGRTYPRLSSNSPRGNYSLTDDTLCDPENKGSVWIYAEEIRSNVERYARRHGVDKLVHLNTRVTSITPLPPNPHPTDDIHDADGNPPNRWEILTVPTSSPTSPLERVEADIVIACTGLFSVPRTPSKNPSDTSYIPGLDSFGGWVGHSSDAADPDAIGALLESGRGKSASPRNEGEPNAGTVLVVGYGKSALDLAEWMGLLYREDPEKYPKPVMVFRKPHWFLPMSFFSNLDSHRRSGQPGPWWRPVWVPGSKVEPPSTSLPPEKTEARGSADTKTSSKGPDVSRSSVSKRRQDLAGGKKLSVEQGIVAAIGIDPTHPCVPTYPFGADSSFGVASENFFELVKSGHIGTIRGHIAHVQGNDVTIVVDKESPGPDPPKPYEKTMRTHALLLCTGYTFSFPYFPPSLLASLGLDGSYRSPPLWRTVQPPSLLYQRNLFFNGMFNSASCSINIDVCAQWIAESLAGGVAVPKGGGEEVWRQVREFGKMDGRFTEGGGLREGKVYVFGRFIDFADDCIMDMRLPTVMVHPDPIKDYFALYHASAWGRLGEERRRTREQRRKQIASWAERVPKL